MLEENKNETLKSDGVVEHDERLIRRARYEDMMARTRKMKRRMILISLATLTVLAILLGSLLLFEYTGMMEASELRYEEYEFFEPYGHPITENATYMARDRKVYYCYSSDGLGLTEEVTEQTTDRGAAFLYVYFEVIKSGNVDAYNMLFNEHYFAEHAPQAAFHPQMVYDILICYESTAIAENGDTLRSYFLEYKIQQNDGSFRRDIGSNMSRRQVITLRIAKSGDGVLIEDLYVIPTVQPDLAEPSLALILSVILIPVLLIVGIVMLLIFYRKREKQEEQLGEIDTSDIGSDDPEDVSWKS